MWVRLAALLLAPLVVAGCSGAPEDAAGPPPPEVTDPQDDPQDTESPAATAPGATAPSVTPSGPFPVAEVGVETAAGPRVPIAVHVAADPATRARGLMHREDVPPGTGMLFLFPGDTASGFWMKDTLVPLSIAFAAADGAILRILDMEPCTADPCPGYDPGTSYRMALEVAAGEFARLGVAEGDTLLVPEDLPAAR